MKSDKKYIDVNKTLSFIEKKGKHYCMTVSNILNCKDIVKQVPAADVAEVQHGYNATNMHPVDEFVCSVCGFACTDFTEIVTDNDNDDDIWYRECEFSYCPNCGACMDKNKK